MNKLLYGALVACGALLVGVSVAYAADFNFGFGVTSNATASDVGLPAYPGSRPHKDGKDDEGAAKVWGAFGWFGLKVAAVSLESDDPPAKIAQFYAGALGRYGHILDCSAGRPRPPKADKHSHMLDCDDDHMKPGEFLFKTGRKEEFRVVGIEPLGRGSRIALVYVQTRGID